MMTARLTESPDPVIGKPLLLDGSMGQELINRGAGHHDLLWAAGALLHSPHVVRDIHLDYIRAGADVITTNSYSTIRNKFEPAGLSHRFEEMNRLAGQLAVEARDQSRTPVLIAGSLPPQRGSYRPDRVGDFDEILSLYQEQVELLAPYVDLFLCETMSSAREAQAAAMAASDSGKPVWVSWTLADSGPPRLRSGESLVTAAGALKALQPAAVLVNCSPPEIIGNALSALSLAADTLPWGAYANGFTPIPDQWDYDGDESLPPSRTDLDPKTYCGFAAQWLEAGASIIGGCCEIGPAHIKALRKVIAAC